MWMFCNQKLRAFFREEDGPTAVEYAVMLALIIVVCIISIRAVGTTTSGTFDEVESILNPKTDGNQDGNGQF